MTPGKKLAEIIQAQMRGEDTSAMQDEYERLTCEIFVRPGTTVTVGKHRSTNGGEIKKFKK